MKAKLLRDMEADPRPGVTPAEWVTEKNGRKVCPAGLIFEHPQAFYQVLLGNAEAADEECRLKVERTHSPEKLAEVRAAYDELLATGSFTGEVNTSDDDDEYEINYDEGDV